MVVHIYSISTWEAEAGESPIKGQSGLCFKSEASLAT
jgi:hypothetical protein